MKSWLFLTGLQAVDLFLTGHEAVDSFYNHHQKFKKEWFRCIRLINQVSEIF